MRHSAAYYVLTCSNTATLPTVDDIIQAYTLLTVDHIGHSLYHSDRLHKSVTIEDAPIPFSPFSAVNCTMLNHFSFEDFVAIAFPDLAGDLDIQI